MKRSDYPSQEPLSEVGWVYSEVGWALSRDIEGEEIAWGDHPCQRLMVYPAARPGGDVLIFMIGGGWTNGHKEMVGFLAPPLNAAGVTLVSLGYRLAPEYVYPDGFEDVANGIGWAARNIAGFGGDPERIFAGGHSAGGHYAALAAVREDWPESLGLAANPVRGCLPVSGTFEFGPDSGLAMRPRFLGPEGSGAAAEASPARRIARTPPMLIATGAKDFPHLIAQADRFGERLTGAGGEVERLVVPMCDHFGVFFSLGNPQGAWMQRAPAWMQEH